MNDLKTGPKGVDVACLRSPLYILTGVFVCFVCFFFQAAVVPDVGAHREQPSVGGKPAAQYCAQLSLLRVA